VTGGVAGEVFDLRVVPGPSVADVAEETSWRERAEGAEQRLAVAEARIEELTGQVAVLARMLFGRSSEKASAGTGGAGPVRACWVTQAPVG
jgi:hypothetical protein